jgi:hypothetical protein
MRKIKFRAWDKSQKYMAYQGTPDLETIQSFMHHFGNKVLMQYIGLNDKNGNEIYEGDVVKLSEGHIVEIKFQDGGFGYEGMINDFIGFAGHNWLTEIQSRYEVLGNLYENSELKSQLKNYE